MAGISSEYLKDESRLTGFAEKIIFAGKAEEIETCLQNEKHVTIQGSRTGIAGACVPFGGTILNLSRLQGIEQAGTDSDGCFLDVLPGTTIDQLKDFIKRRAKGYCLLTEPTESTASVGGAFAVNAQGPSPLKSCGFADMVTEADVYFPSIGKVTVHRGDKISAIFPKKDDFIIEDKDLLETLSASEGAFGVIGKVRLKLVKEAKKKWSLLVFPGEEEKALDLAEKVLESTDGSADYSLDTLDLMDASSLAIVKEQIFKSDRYARIPEYPDGSAALLIEISGNKEEALEETLEGLMLLFEEAEIPDESIWAADSDDEREVIRVFRHAVPECINNLIDKNRLNCDQIRKVSMDVHVGEESAAVSVQKIRSYIAENADYKGKIINSAITIHLGRSVFHIDLIPEDEESFQQSLACSRGLVNMLAAEGGVPGWENGIGKQRYQLSKITKNQKDFAVLKKYFDPENVLNTGYREDCL